MPIYPHSKFAPKTCPGTKFPLQEVLQRMFNPKAKEEVSAWAKEAHDWVVKSNISDDTRPKDPVTREEAWQMFYDFYKKEKVKQCNIKV